MNFKDVKPFVRRHHYAGPRYYTRSEIQQKYFYGFMGGVFASWLVFEFVFWITK